MQSPRLPWEVIERVIDHSRDHPSSLCSFSLTCSQLVPRSRCVMLEAGVDLKTRDHIFALVDFLQDNPHLKPFISSIIVRPTDFAPFPLLHILPDLSEIAFTSSGPKDPRSRLRVPSLHPSVLTCSQRFGSRIQTLRLFKVSFATPLAFFHLLAAFSTILHLACTDVAVGTEVNQGPSALVKRRLSEQLRLKSLSIDLRGQDGDGNAYVAQALLHPDFKSALSTVESFTLIDVVNSGVFLGIRLSEWCRLQSLTLHLPHNGRLITNIVKLLGNADRTILKDVTLQFGPVWAIIGLMRDLGSASYAQLEHILLEFPRVTVTWTKERPLRADCDAFWTREIRKLLPKLSQHGAVLEVKSETAFSAGHDDSISVLAVSPDSKWVASASYDSTIVLWDALDGRIARQCAFPHYQALLSLAFSPDCHYLVCGAHGGKVAIWDLSESASVIEAFEAHDQAVSSCAWSLDGTVFATASIDGTVRLWDASTFRTLHVLLDDTKGPRYDHNVAFSPDGRWLAFASSSNSACYIWAAPEWRLHKVIDHHKSLNRFGAYPDMGIAVAFSPQRRRARIVTVPGHCRLELWDIQSQTGGKMFASSDMGKIHALSFSPDGQLVLVALQDGTVKVWDAGAGVEVLELKGHQKAVLDARFSPCGRYIASASGDRTALLWRVSDGTCVAKLSERKAPVGFVAFSPDGKTLSTAAGDGTVVIRHMQDIILFDEQAP